VPSLNDEQFEHQLKEFRPLSPAPLPTIASKPASRRSLVFAAWATAAALLGVVFLAVHSHRGQSGHAPEIAQSSIRLEQLTSSEPLTLGRANKLLGAAPSFKAVTDEIAFPRRTQPSSQRSTSALTVLSQEKIKL